ncbi:MAG: M20/M25/M40 family metallo-hydrolase [Actinomycetota bacterium]|nr:M20/M25/M40 family metallo-hydrolase [Actinomycetota bacterium]
MDDAGRQQLISELCSFEQRGPGTDAERRAANMLAGRLREMGRRAEVEPTYVQPQYAVVHLIHALLGVAGSVIGISEPAIGFAVVLFAATSMYLDLNTRFYLVRRLLFRRASQNVVSPGANPSAPIRLALVAHYDAARSGYVFGERSLRPARRLSERGRVLLGPWRLVFWGGVAALLPVLGLRMAGLEDQWVSILQLLPTVLLIVAVFLLTDIALSDIVPGAYDNASGVACVLSAADRLRDERLAPNLDVWIVLTGAEECLGEGMRSFVRAHRGDLDPERTVIVNVDSVSYGSVHYETSEGPVISTSMDPELVELCEALASAGDGAPAARPVRSPLLTDALPARVRGLRAISIAGLEGGLPPPWYHTHEDTPGRVDAKSLSHATEFVVGLARLLDREGARRVRA